MAELQVDPKTGFCSATKIYHSLLPPSAPLPPEHQSLSVTDYIFSLLHTTTTRINRDTTTAALIDSATGDHLSYSEFIQQTQSLTFSLQKQFSLSKGDIAFILSPSSLQIPILYLSLLSLGIIISPSNPINTNSEISHQLKICKPTIAFVTSDFANKLPTQLRNSAIFLDSPDFQSMKTVSGEKKLESVEVTQSDTAAILYSSGTTGKVKGVIYTHRNLISGISGTPPFKSKRRSTTSMFSAVPLFHVYGFFGVFRSVAMGGTVVTTTERFDLGRMMKAVEEFKVTHLAVAPPIILALVKGYLDLTNGYDLSSLECFISGGAPLAVEVILKFRERFPNFLLVQGYGLTECAGGVSRTDGESNPLGSVGTLAANLQVKIVDPETGALLPPCKHGELCIKGPIVMRGYVFGDENEALSASSTLDSDGWLRTGDQVYMDNDGFVFVIDRLKELIKYKGYQVPPGELEALLLSHPSILDAAVIPYPNEEVGEVPMAYIVRKTESRTFIDEPEVMNFIAKQVAPYKKLRRVAFIDSIPRNASGKILRRELKRLALLNHISSSTTTTKSKL